MVEKYALVTGGSSGIGLELAHQLAKRKYNLLLVSNQPDRLIELKFKLKEEYTVDVMTLEIDLARVTAANEVFDHCTTNHIDVEVLANNAGMFFFDQITEVDITKAEKKILLHVLTTSQLCTLFGNKMKKDKIGYILNVASMSAYRPFPGIAHYGATKSYLTYFTRCLRTELRPFGVQVSCLSPGATITNLFDTSDLNIDLGRKLGIFVTPQLVASKAIKGLFANKAVIIPGRMTRIQIVMAQLTPQFIIQLIWNWYIRRKN